MSLARGGVRTGEKKTGSITMGVPGERITWYLSPPGSLPAHGCLEKDTMDLSAFPAAAARCCSAAWHRHRSEQSHPTMGSMKVWRLLVAPVRPFLGIFHLLQ